jgi:hypothetical protein
MKLEINGRIVEVDDSFADLSDAEKQATVDEIAKSFQTNATPQSTEDKLINPAGATLAGSGTALALGRLINAFESGADVDVARLAKEFNIPPDVVAKGPDAVKNYIRAMHTGDISYVGGESYKEAHALTEKAKEMARNAPSGYKYDPDAQQYIPESEYEQRAAARAKAQQKSKPIGTRVVEKYPIVGRGSLGAQNVLRHGVPPFIGRTAVGGFGGYSGAEAYNRALQGDIPGAAISGTGAVGALSSLSRNPKLRALGILGMGASAVANQMYDSPAEKPDIIPESIKSIMPNRAGGGSIKGYQKGKAVKSGLDLLVGKETPSISKLKDQATPLWQRFGYDPKKIAQQYPEVLPPIEKIDPKTGKTYPGKQLSQEALAVQKARQAAQKEIDAGNYTPYFDITKRSYVNPSDYPLSEKTLGLTMPKKADTLEKHRALAQSPEATVRLESAYEAASGSPTAHGFYMMKQLQDEYVKELGPELGRTAFKRDFADPMAATTGGQTPTANLMMTAMHNYFANKGLPMPSKGYDIPYPVGGNKLQSNIDMSQKLFNTGALSAADSPKRFNFSSNFLGHSDRPTIDEQMMSLFSPGGKGAPDWYGVNEEAVNILAKKRGVDPVNYQEVAWAGAKGYPGQPMIEDVNQMLYRTSRITGEPQEEVLRGFIRRNKPMYGVTGLGALGLQDTGGVNNPE